MMNADVSSSRAPGMGHRAPPAEPRPEGGADVDARVNFRSSWPSRETGRGFIGQERGLLMSAIHMVDEATIRAVCDYLRANFPGMRIVPSIDKGVQEFRIADIYGMPLHTLALTNEFFRAHAPSIIPSVLRRHRTARALNRSARVVQITDSGVIRQKPVVRQLSKRRETPG